MPTDGPGGTGPGPGYGLIGRRSDGARSTTAEQLKATRSFLATVDPVTGCIENDPDDDGDDDTVDH